MALQRGPDLSKKTDMQLVMLALVRLLQESGLETRISTLTLREQLYVRGAAKGRR